MKRRDLKRRDIQQQFLEIGYRANFVSNPLNKQIVSIEIATDDDKREWIKRADSRPPATADISSHPQARDLAHSLEGAFLYETGQKIVS